MRIYTLIILFAITGCGREYNSNFDYKIENDKVITSSGDTLPHLINFNNLILFRDSYYYVNDNESGSSVYSLRDSVFYDTRMKLNSVGNLHFLSMSTFGEGKRGMSLDRSLSFRYGAHEEYGSCMMLITLGDTLYLNENAYYAEENEC